MKRFILLALLCIIACSCGVVTRTRSVTSLFLDYRPYTSADFFLSPNAYTGDFEPVGELNIIVDPAVVEIRYSSANKFSDNIYSNAPRTPVTQELIPESELLEIAVGEAIKKGANGISNLKIEVSTEFYGYTKGSVKKVIDVYKYHITGFCIIRK